MVDQQSDKREPDGYAVLHDDRQSAPRGFWYAGIYHTSDVAEQAMNKMRSDRVVPMWFGHFTKHPDCQGGGKCKRACEQWCELLPLKTSAPSATAAISQVLPLQPQPATVTTSTGPATGSHYTIPGPWAPPSSTRRCEGIYVASRVKHSMMWRKRRSSGAPISSTWIDEDENLLVDYGALWQRVRSEIAGCKALVFYARPEDFPLKGALVEVGMALAMGKPVHAVIEDVMLDAGMRPVGSWFGDRGVEEFATLDEAIAAAVALPSVTVSAIGAISVPREQLAEWALWLKGRREVAGSVSLDSIEEAIKELLNRADGTVTKP